jgi:protein ImuB
VENSSVLCVCFPCWPVQRLVAGDGELRCKPIVLFRNLAQRGQIVTEASPAAQAAGVRSGMPLSEARSLVRRSRYGESALHVVEHDLEADARALRELAMGCERFSPVVGQVHTETGRDPLTGLDAAPAALWLEAGTVLHLFGGARGLLSAVGRHFEKAGYMIRQAIASTPGKAWGLARFAESDFPDEALFDALPVEALRLPADVVSNLQQLGVQRISELRKLPRAGLLSRFGESLTRRLDQADGLVGEVVEGIYPPPDYRAAETLDYPVSDRDSVLVVLERMIRRLCEEMRGKQRGGLVWHCRLSSPQQPPSELAVRLFRPTAVATHILPLVATQLDGMFREKGIKKSRGVHQRTTGFGVVDFEVSVRNCVLLAERQRELFDENPRRDLLALGQLIDRLSSRLGAEQVVRPRLQKGTMAEDAALFEPLAGRAREQEAERRSSGAAAASRRRPRRGKTASQDQMTGQQARLSGCGGLSPLQRPLVLLPEPRAIDAVSVDGRPSTDINVPMFLLIGGERWLVQRCWGPERIETAWWRGPTVRRDYWRIEVQTGRWLWVFRDLRKRKWFLHGEF